MLFFIQSSSTLIEADDLSTNNDEMISNDSVQNEQSPIAGGLRIGRVVSLNDRSPSAPSASEMSNVSNTDHGMHTPQPDFDPFIALVSNGYNGIKGRKVRRNLQQKILKLIADAEDEDENIS